MVMPIPAAAFGGSPAAIFSPSFMKTMSIVFSVFLALEIVLSGIRFYVLDIWGGVIMILIAVFGAFVVRYQFDLQWTMMFGITIFFYGLIHLVMTIERAVLLWPDFPDVSAKEIRVLMRDWLLIVAPVVDWTLAALSFYIFRRSTSALFGGFSDEERQPLRGRDRSGSAVMSSNNQNASSATSSFTPFSGQGRKLA